MSDLTHSTIAILVRNRLDLPASARIRIQSLVNTGLQRLGKKVAQDRHKRQYILTDKASVTASLTSGYVDLSTLIEANGIQLEYITYGYVWHGSNALQWKRGPDLGGMAGPFDTVFPHCWLEGEVLYTKGTNGSVLSGTLSFSVPYIPSLSQLSSTLNDDLLDEIVGLMRETPDDYYETPGNPE